MGDHFIAAKNPDAFNEAVAAFLADTRGDDAGRQFYAAQGIGTDFQRVLAGEAAAFACQLPNQAEQLRSPTSTRRP